MNASYGAGHERKNSVLFSVSWLFSEYYNMLMWICERYVRFEVFTVVTMKNAVFWYVARCKPSFRKNVSPPSSWQKNPRARNQREQVAADCHMLTLVSRSWMFLPWRWRRNVLPKRRFTQHLHGATSQKTAFFMWRMVCHIQKRPLRRIIR
jgi:hypothetical protein